jgi:hypothetical protein
METLLQSLGIAQLPEIKTDVGSDLDAVIRANGARLGIGMFVIIVLAILLALFLAKRLIK